MNHISYDPWVQFIVNALLVHFTDFQALSIRSQMCLLRNVVIPDARAIVAADVVVAKDVIASRSSSSSTSVKQLDAFRHRVLTLRLVASPAGHCLTWLGERKPGTSQ